MLKRIIAISILFLFLLLVGITAYINGQAVPQQELARRCTASKPEWAGYEEDIKGQIGAAPSAQWRGEPIAAERSEQAVNITFRLTGPWAVYAFAMPVLLRDPLGKTYCGVTAESKGADRIYRFNLAAESTGAPLPWIELRYPHGQQRIAFDASGKWMR